MTDLLPAAINDALAKARQLHMEAMSSVTEDLPMPDNLEGLMNSILGSGSASPAGDGDASPGDETDGPRPS